MASVLGIDTSAAACSAAIWRDGAVLVSLGAAMMRGHAEALVPMIERAMGQAGLAYRDLAAVAATRGPGAFTGLRIGLATVRGLALAAGIPAIGISAFEAGYFKSTYKVPFPMFPDPDFKLHKLFGEVRTPYFIGARLEKGAAPAVYYSKLGGAKDAAELFNRLLQHSGMK